MDQNSLRAVIIVLVVFIVAASYTGYMMRKEEAAVEPFQKQAEAWYQQRPTSNRTIIISLYFNRGLTVNATVLLADELWYDIDWLLHEQVWVDEWPQVLEMMSILMEEGRRIDPNNKRLTRAQAVYWLFLVHHSCYISERERFDDLEKCPVPVYFWLHQNEILRQYKADRVDCAWILDALWKAADLSPLSDLAWDIMKAVKRHEHDCLNRSEL